MMMSSSAGSSSAATGSSSNRVQDILKRMDENCSQPEAIKTCFGILAIMSRDESNKGKDYMESVVLLFVCIVASVEVANALV
jgi:20S proteasome alpha/beta subunit